MSTESASSGGPLIVLFFILVAGVVIWMFSASSRVKVPLTLAPSSPVVLYGHLYRPGAAVPSAWNATTYGTITLANGQFRWRGADGASWAAPFSSIAVLRTAGMFNLTGPGRLKLTVDGTGEWIVVVSDKPINKFMRNGAKDVREAETARRLAGLLLQGGARDQRS